MPPELRPAPSTTGSIAAPARARLWDDGYGRTAVRCAQTLLIVAAAGLLIWLLVRLRLVVVPLLVTTMIAAAVWPLVGWLRSRGVPRGLAAGLALLAGGGALAFLLWIVVNGVRGEWDELRASAEGGLVELQRFLTSPPLNLDTAQIEEGREAVVSALSGEQVRAQAVDTAALATEIIAGMFLGIVLLFFLLKDGPRIWAFLARWLPGEQQPRVARIGERSVAVLGGYVRGTTIIALVDAVVIGLGLFFLGVPLALPLAVLVFLGAYIPLAGATIAGFIAALVALVANGPVVALLVVALVIAVNQIEGDVLAPLVLGKAVSLHPLVILLALSIGAIVAGVIGALLAVPLTAVAWTVVTAWNEQREVEDPGAVAVPADATRGTGE